MLKAPFLINILIGSTLLFWVQPMLAKALLPMVGGAPAVWIVSMLFFQLFLLAGYGYAALGSAFLKPRAQLLLHLALYFVAFALTIPLSITHPAGFEATSPEWWVLLTLGLSVGFPYFLLSANATLLQRWYHAQHQQTPYFLFSLSNIGSLIGLLGYPFLVEWLLPLGDQMQLWSYGFIALLVGLMVITITMFTTKQSSEDKASHSLGKALAWRSSVKVIALGFAPSSLFLSVTLVVTTDIASFPLLWVIPLALYLISFIIAFSRFNAPITAVCQKLHLFAAILVISLSIVVGVINSFLALQIVAFFAMFFILAMSCHGKIALMRPEPSQLTAYYFWLSFGGALGGLFNTAAPYLFHDIYEHFIAIAVSLIALPLATYQFRAIKLPLFGKTISQKASTAIVACFIAGIALYIVQLRSANDNVLFKDRTFFGVSTVKLSDKGDEIVFRHGSTLHGFQPTQEEHRLNVTSYYGPIKSLLNQLPDRFFDHPMGVLGLGAGVTACFAREGEPMDFFEIDPLVIEIAKDPKLFTFLRDCPGQFHTILGDGRIKLAEKPDGYYGLIVMDAFTSDAIPMHLLTLEALAIYQQKLVPQEGIIAFNISNRFLDLSQVLAKMAQHRDLDAFYLRYQAEKDSAFEFSSIWLVMTPKDSPWQAQIEALGFERITAVEKTPLWTDAYSNLLSALK